MKFRLKDWAFFLICEGLFLLGLSVGIWGSENFKPDPVAALVFLGASLVSLLIGGAILLNFRSGAQKRGKAFVSNPISLDDSFRAFLRFRDQPPLFQDPNFETHFLVLREGRQRIQIKAASACLIEHWQGPSIDIQHSNDQHRLSAREVVRIYSPESSELVIRKAQENNTEDEMECRFLVHFISAPNSPGVLS